MARRKKKNSSADDFIALISMLPWWGGVALAVLSYIVFACPSLTVSLKWGAHKPAANSESDVSTIYGLRGACASRSRSVSCSQSCISFFALRWLAMAISRMAACSGKTVR